MILVCQDCGAEIGDGHVCKKAPTPLDIAVQEYAYWRAAGDDDRFLDIAMGAMGAAANITSRLAGGNLEGIDYKSLSPEEITRLLQEIRLAPKMAIALLVVHEFFAKLEDGLPADDPISKIRKRYHQPIHAVLDPLIAELKPPVDSQVL